MKIFTSIIQSELRKVLKENILKNVIIYADDIIIYTKEESLGVKNSLEKFQTASKKVLF